MGKTMLLVMIFVAGAALLYQTLSHSLGVDENEAASEDTLIEGGQSAPVARNQVGVNVAGIHRSSIHERTPGAVTGARCARRRGRRRSTLIW